MTSAEISDTTSRSRFLRRRPLTAYPASSRQAAYLSLALTTAVALAWCAQVAGAVAPQIMAQYGMSFRYYIAVAIVSIAVGALGSSTAGLADRIGRVTIISGGLFLHALLVLFAIPKADDKSSYLVLSALAGLIEGATGVALPALVRDFSPQVRRATAMALWALGPVLGALLVHAVASHTLDAHPDWRFQFRICGTVGLLVALATAIWLRELAPGLRNQLIVVPRDQELAELRAHAQAQPQRRSRRSVLGLDVLASSVAISLYLIFYYTQVGFFVVYLLTNFGYTAARANSLANWYWLVSAGAMLSAGALSDRLQVRKPLMVTGALISAAASALVAVCSTRADTRYHTFAVILILAAIGNGLAFAPWMAAHTETVERRNPAASAAGLALWSAVNKIVVTGVLISFAFTVTAPSILVDNGPRVDQIAQANPNVVHALTTRRPLPSGTTISPVDLSYLQAHLHDVLTASQHGPHQWQTWWWICVAGQLAFIPIITLMAGSWRPRTAQADLQVHAAQVTAALYEAGEPAGLDRIRLSDNAGT